MFLLGDVSLSAEDKPPPYTAKKLNHTEIESSSAEPLPLDHTAPNDDDLEEYDEEEEHHNWLEGHTALKFLTAGGIAGAGESEAVPT